MKRLCATFLSFSLLLASCSSSIQNVTATPGPGILDTPWEDRSIFKSGLVSSEQSVLDELPTASIYHLEINIAEDLYHISGTEQVRYTNAEELALDEVQLHLFPNVLGGEMTVSNLKVDEASVRAKYELEDSLLIVPFPKPLEPNQSVIL